MFEYSTPKPNIPSISGHFNIRRRMPQICAPTNRHTNRVGTESNAHAFGINTQHNVHIMTPMPSNAIVCDMSGHWLIKCFQLCDDTNERFIGAADECCWTCFNCLQQAAECGGHVWWNWIGLKVYHFGPEYSILSSTWLIWLLAVCCCCPCASSRSTDATILLMFTAMKSTKTNYLY